MKFVSENIRDPLHFPLRSGPCVQISHHCDCCKRVSSSSQFFQEMFFTIPSAIPVVKAYNSASAGLKLTDCCVLDHAERDKHLHRVTPPLVLLHVWCCPAQSLSGYTLMNCGNVLISTKHFLCNRNTFHVSPDALHVHLAARSTSFLLSP